MSNDLVLNKQESTDSEIILYQESTDDLQKKLQFDQSEESIDHSNRQDKINSDQKKYLNDRSTKDDNMINNRDDSG